VPQRPLLAGFDLQRIQDKKSFITYLRMGKSKGYFTGNEGLERRG
jgi:hypothetical protein